MRDRATLLRQTHPRDELDELAEEDFEDWARVESFELAKDIAYRGGDLEGSTDREDGEPLPSNYGATTQPIAWKRAALGGYRLAEILKDLAAE